MLNLDLSNPPPHPPGQAVEADIEMFYLSALVLILDPPATRCVQAAPHGGAVFNLDNTF